MIVQLEIDLETARKLCEITKDASFLLKIDDRRSFSESSIRPVLKKASKSRKYQLGFLPYDVKTYIHEFRASEILSSIISFAHNQMKLYLEELLEKEDELA